MYSKQFLSPLVAAVFVAFSLRLWLLAFELTDWAVIALAPLAFFLAKGAWPLARDPWRAMLHAALREDGKLARFITGGLRATVLSIIFAVGTTAVLAWQALNTTGGEAAILLVVFWVSGFTFSFFEARLSRELHPPFARTVATSLTTWFIALPSAVLFAAHSWYLKLHPGEVLGASLTDAMALDPLGLSDREGWIASVLQFLEALEGGKLWAVVQLRDHPIAGYLFSLDAALFVFLWCRAGIVVTQFFEDIILEERGK